MRIDRNYVGRHGIAFDLLLQSKTSVTHKLLSENPELMEHVNAALFVFLENICDEMSKVYQRRRETHGETLYKPDPL